MSTIPELTEIQWGCCPDESCPSEQDSSKYLQCITCGKPFHFECLGLGSSSASSTSADHNKWKCPTCSNSDKKNQKKDGTPIRTNTNVTVRAIKRQALQSPSPPNHASAEPAVTTGEIRAIVEEVTDKRSEILLRQLTQSLRSILTSELKVMKDEIAGLKNSFDFMSAKYDEIAAENKDMKETMGVLMSENEGLKSTVSNLSLRLNNLEQSARSCNIEVQCIPEKKEENLIGILNKLSSVIEYPLSSEKIANCKRIAKMNTKNNRPRSIVVQFTTPRERDNFLAAAIKFNKPKPKADKLNTGHLGLSGAIQPIFIQEHLSPVNKALHAATRSAAKDRGYKHVWVRNGRIFVRKTDTSEYIVINNMDSLSKL